MINFEHISHIFLVFLLLTLNFEQVNVCRKIIDSDAIQISSEKIETIHKFSNEKYNSKLGVHSDINHAVPVVSDLSIV